MRNYKQGIKYKSKISNLYITQLDNLLRKLKLSKQKFVLILPIFLRLSVSLAQKRAVHKLSNVVLNISKKYEPTDFFKYNLYY